MQRAEKKGRANGPGAKPARERAGHGILASTLYH